MYAELAKDLGKDTGWPTLAVTTKFDLEGDSDLVLTGFPPREAARPCQTTFNYQRNGTCVYSVYNCVDPDEEANSNLFIYKKNGMKEQLCGWPIFKEFEGLGRTLVGFHLQSRRRPEDAKEEEKQGKNEAVHFTEELFKFIF